MRWLKNKRMYSWGPTPWEYIPLFDDSDLSEAALETIHVDPLIEIHNECASFSDIEWEVVPTEQVPNYLIERAYQDTLYEIEHSKEELRSFNKQRELLKPLRGKGRDEGDSS